MQVDNYMVQNIPWAVQKLLTVQKCPCYETQMHTDITIESLLSHK